MTYNVTLPQKVLTKGSLVRKNHELKSGQISIKSKKVTLKSQEVKHSINGHDFWT